MGVKGVSRNGASIRWATGTMQEVAEEQLGYWWNIPCLSAIMREDSCTSDTDFHPNLTNSSQSLRGQSRVGDAGGVSTVTVMVGEKRPP